MSKACVTGVGNRGGRRHTARHANECQKHVLLSLRGLRSPELPSSATAF
jgi:hypothetical protein